MNNCEHKWRRVQPIPGTKSFEIVCTLCNKEALEIRSKVAPLTQFGHVYNRLADIIQELEHNEREIDET